MDKLVPVGDDLTDEKRDLTFPSVNDLTTSSITSRFLVRILDDANVAVDDVLGSAAVTRDQLSSPDCRIPLASFRELWARAALLQSDIGLLLVDSFPEGQMHVLAHLAMRSATVGEAMEALCRYASVTSQADFMRIEKIPGAVRFIFEHRSNGLPNPWLSEHYFSMILAFLSRAVDRPLPIRRIEFSLPAQASLAAYQNRFGLLPLFDTGTNAIEFEVDVLAWPLLTHDAYMHGILDKVVKAEFLIDSSPASASNSFLDMARREIAKGFLKGAAPNIESIALAFQSGVRSFRDRLASENTNFRALLDDVRRSLGKEHLSQGFSVSETAYLLGFSEPSAFQHACKRWFGKSAGDLRRELFEPAQTAK